MFFREKRSLNPHIYLKIVDRKYLEVSYDDNQQALTHEINIVIPALAITVFERFAKVPQSLSRNEQNKLKKILCLYFSWKL
jgi:hypothetical protein